MSRLGVLLLALLCARPALAAPPASEAERQARDLYRSGLSHHNLAEYDAAIADFKRAYELTHAPGLLFNLAQSSRLRKDYDQALHFYRTYLRELPAAPNRRDVEALIELVEAQARQAPALTTPPPTTPPPTAATPPPTVATPPPEVRVIMVPAPPPRPSHRRAFIVGGAVTLGAGVLALAAGVGLGVHAGAQADALAGLRARGATWDAQAQATYDDGARSASAATALYVVGGTLAAAGLVVVVVGATRQRVAGPLALSPRLGPRGVGVEVTCAF